jgi:hypothetical protein
VRGILLEELEQNLQGPQRLIDDQAAAATTAAPVGDALDTRPRRPHRRQEFEGMHDVSYSIMGDETIQLVRSDVRMLLAELDQSRQVRQLECEEVRQRRLQELRPDHLGRPGGRLVRREQVDHPWPARRRVHGDADGKPTRDDRSPKGPVCGPARAHVVSRLTTWRLAWGLPHRRGAPRVDRVVIGDCVAAIAVNSS